MKIHINHKLTVFNLNQAMRDRGGKFARNSTKIKDQGVIIEFMEVS